MLWLRIYVVITRPGKHLFSAMLYNLVYMGNMFHQMIFVFVLQSTRLNLKCQIGARKGQVVWGFGGLKKKKKTEHKVMSGE